VHVMNLLTCYIFVLLALKIEVAHSQDQVLFCSLCVVWSPDIIVHF